MAKYTIIINNKSGQNQEFFLYSENPTITNAPNIKIDRNPWITCPNTPDDNSCTINFTDNFYGYWGLTTPGTTTVTDSQVKPVNLGPTGTTLNFTTTPYPVFTVLQQKTTQEGAFTIKTTADFTNDSNFVLGVAKDSEEQSLVPIATFQAQPNTTYVITPVTTFYVATGITTHSDIIDVNTIGFKIDFTGKNDKTAVIVYDKSNNYTIYYYNEIH